MVEHQTSHCVKEDTLVEGRASARLALEEHGGLQCSGRCEEGKGQEEEEEDVILRP